MKCSPQLVVRQATVWWSTEVLTPCGSDGDHSQGGHGKIINIDDP